MSRALSKTLSVSLCVVMMSGCAGLSQRACLSHSWESMGEADARAGLTEARFAQYKQQCQARGVAINAEGYFAGYQRGLSAFCSPNQLFELGATGAEFPSQCHILAAVPVREYFVAGVQIHEIKQAQRQLRERLAQSQQRVFELNQRTDLDAPTLAAQRQAAYTEQAQISTRLVNLDSMIDSLTQSFQRATQAPKQ